jgi:hypothetical protein
LLVAETKAPGELPEDLGQAIFYSTWTKAVAYIVTDGERLKGYYRNSIASDIIVISSRFGI